MSGVENKTGVSHKLGNIGIIGNPTPDKTILTYDEILDAMTWKNINLLVTGVGFFANTFNTENIAAETLVFLAPVGINTESNTEIDRQIVINQEVEMKNLTIAITSNATTATSAIRLRINGVDGNQLIIIPAGATGVFQDLINTDLIDAFDFVTYGVVKGLGGALQVQAMTIGLFAL